MASPSRPRRRGQSMVEMAIMLPLLLFLFLGIVESALMFFAWVTVQNAARTGTRVAVTGKGMSDATRVAQVKAATQAIVNRLYQGNTATITVQSWASPTATGTPTNDDAGSPCFLVQVQVSYTYSPLMPFIKSLMPSTIVLKGTDRKLNEPWSQCT